MHQCTGCVWHVTKLKVFWCRKSHFPGYDDVTLVDRILSPPAKEPVARIGQIVAKNITRKARLERNRKPRCRRLPEATGNRQVPSLAICFGYVRVQVFRVTGKA